MTHPAIAPGRAAVITGAASGVGLAAARSLAAHGMAVCLADRDAAALDRAAASIAGDVLAVPTDVSDAASVAALRDAALARWGAVAVLMNNAGIGGGGQIKGDPARWRAILETNLWGVIHGVQAFLPAMLQSGQPGCIINTGSKQGITTPPGDTAYNVSKAGIKVLTEGLAHDLLGTPLTAHLLIPGFTFTAMTRPQAEPKPPGAWTPQQVIDFMLPALDRGDFYILCPDNDTTREQDQRRMEWAMGDVIANRPALSRWHPDWAEAFARHMAGERR